VWRGDTELRGSNVQSDSSPDGGAVAVRSWALIAGDGLREHDSEVAYPRSIDPLVPRGAWTNYFVRPFITHVMALHAAAPRRTFGGLVLGLH
jgi:hypothetical protein